MDLEFTGGLTPVPMCGPQILGALEQTTGRGKKKGRHLETLALLLT